MGLSKRDTLFFFIAIAYGLNCVESSEKKKHDNEAEDL